MPESLSTTESKKEEQKPSLLPPIITASQRLAEHRGIKGCILGKVGIGKTSLLKTLDPATTLFFDLEAGDLAIGDWPVSTIRPKTWEQCRDFALLIGGANPIQKEAYQPYSDARYKQLCKEYSQDFMAPYETVFIDSITVASRLCLQWCKQQPEAIAASGKNDPWKIYSLVGQEMMTWLIHLQHTRDKNIWFVGILEKKLDTFSRAYHQLQCEGSKTGLELPGIVDQVITLSYETIDVEEADGKITQKSGRFFICQSPNPYDYPAKDRSGKLSLLEEPHLERLMRKISPNNTPQKGS